MNRAVAVITIAALLPLGCASGAPPAPLFGAPVEVRTRQQSAPPKGELVSVDPGAIVVRGPAGVRSIPLAEVTSVRVKRGDIDRRVGFRWTLIGALISGVGLSVSCSTVSGAHSCAGVGGAAAGLWILLGGLASTAMDGPSHRTFRDPIVERLRPFARFPQGLPPGLDLDSLGPSATEAEPPTPPGAAAQ